MELSLRKNLRQIIGHSLGADVAEFHLEKAIQAAQEKAAAPMTNFYDRNSLFMGREWLMKKNMSLSYMDLRMMSKNPIISSIIQTRINQVASFCQQQSDSYEPGYLIKSGNYEANKNIERCRELGSLVYTCGLKGYGDNLLETFVRKFLRDSLTMDQAAAEVVPARNGKPAYFVAIDAATIRRLREVQKYALPPKGVPLYAQVIEDQITAQYSYEQMMFGVRNPQTELANNGYGLSELEILMRIVTTILNTERFNSGQLVQGGTSKGVFVVQDDIQADDLQFESFKRDLREAVRNAADPWHVPVLRISKEGKVDWKQLDRSNRDMEFSHLFDFLVKQACGVYQMSPEEINWQIGITGAHANFGSDFKGKMAHSQRKGLKPLLTFLASQINDKFLSPLDPQYSIEFVGYDAHREIDSQIHEREVTTTKTLNEVRAEMNLPPIKGGDIVLNEIYAAAVGLDLNPSQAGGKPVKGKKAPKPAPRVKPGE